jgi:hypothetical protein
MKVLLSAVLLGALLPGCAGDGFLPPDNSDNVRIKRTVPSGQ